MFIHRAASPPPHVTMSVPVEVVKQILYCSSRDNEMLKTKAYMDGFIDGIATVLMSTYRDCTSLYQTVLKFYTSQNHIVPASADVADALIRVSQKRNDLNHRWLSATEIQKFFDCDAFCGTVEKKKAFARQWATAHSKCQANFTGVKCCLHDDVVKRSNLHTFAMSMEVYLQRHL